MMIYCQWHSKHFAKIRSMSSCVMCAAQHAWINWFLFLWCDAAVHGSATWIRNHRHIRAWNPTRNGVWHEDTKTNKQNRKKRRMSWISRYRFCFWSMLLSSCFCVGSMSKCQTHSLTRKHALSHLAWFSGNYWEVTLGLKCCFCQIESSVASTTLTHKPIELLKGSFFFIINRQSIFKTYSFWSMSRTHRSHLSDESFARSPTQTACIVHMHRVQVLRALPDVRISMDVHSSLFVIIDRESFSIACECMYVWMCVWHDSASKVTTQLPSNEGKFNFLPHEQHRPYTSHSLRFYVIKFYLYSKFCSCQQPASLPIIIIPFILFPNTFPNCRVGSQMKLKLPFVTFS